MLDWVNEENKYKIVVPIFGAAYMLHQIKAQ